MSSLPVRLLYLVDLLAAFLVPAVSVQIHGFLSITPAIGEIWMVGYLLLKGVRTVKPDGHILAAAIALPSAQA